jgi:hypothetical protein
MSRRSSRAALRDDDRPLHQPARVPAPRRPRIRAIAADLTDAGSTRDEKGGIGYARLEVGDHITDIQSADGEMRDGQLSLGRAFAQKYRLMYHRHLAIFRQLAHDVRAG